MHFNEETPYVRISPCFDIGLSQLLGYTNFPVRRKQQKKIIILCFKAKALAIFFPIG